MRFCPTLAAMAIFAALAASAPAFAQQTENSLAPLGGAAIPGEATPEVMDPVYRPEPGKEDRLPPDPEPEGKVVNPIYRPPPSLMMRTDGMSLLPYALDAGWKGEKVCEPLFENERLRAARCTFPPGVGHEKHWHPPHWGYIVSGTTMRITDKTGTNDRELPTGGSWWSDGVEWHEALNIGATTGVYVIVEPKDAKP